MTKGCSYLVLWISFLTIASSQTTNGECLCIANMLEIGIVIRKWNDSIYSLHEILCIIALYFFLLL